MNVKNIGGDNFGFGRNAQCPMAETIFFWDAV